MANCVELQLSIDHTFKPPFHKQKVVLIDKEFTSTNSLF